MNKRTIGSALGAAGLIAASALAVLTSSPASATNEHKCEVIKHENLDGVTQHGKGSADLTYWGLGLETTGKHDGVQWGTVIDPPKKLDDVKELSYKTWTKDHGSIPTLRLGLSGYQGKKLLLVFQPGEHLAKSGDVEKGGHGNLWRATDDDAQWRVFKVHGNEHDDDYDNKAAVDGEQVDAESRGRDDDDDDDRSLSWKHVEKEYGRWHVTSLAVGLGPWAKPGDATVNELTVSFGGYRGYDCDKHYWKKPKEEPKPDETTTKPAPVDTEPAAPGGGAGSGDDDGPSLPVTGAGAIGISIAGLSLLAGGALFMMVTRRRRFEA